MKFTHKQLFLKSGILCIHPTWHVLCYVLCKLGIFFRNIPVVYKSYEILEKLVIPMNNIISYSVFMQTSFMNFVFCLSEIQKTIAPKIGNVTFLKKVKLEKGGNKYVVRNISKIIISSFANWCHDEGSQTLLAIWLLCVILAPGAKLAITFTLVGQLVFI